ncbi:hypothetical protein [Bacillus sp. ISL-57]|uniref:hypothetical protein n=1 Tax=Bacillus sp. ISL-57 TaxID=2819135 RepID=UPI001BEB63D6|nr:hypothetical protein [Bacillus sp. ISL-57]MBT2718293.1 hypothetical protein [Bacillus sp. ISL-57]
MKPILHKIDLKSLPKQQRAKICVCKTHCTKGVSITSYNDGFIICWNDARKLLYEMIHTLDEEKTTSWTKEDEEFVIKYYANGVYYRINNEIAEHLGKTYQQVKSKVRNLRKAGRIPNKVNIVDAV